MKEPPDHFTEFRITKKQSVLALGHLKMEWIWHFDNIINENIN